MDGVEFPVPVATTAVYDRGPLTDHAFAGEPASAVFTGIALAPLLGGAAKMAPKVPHLWPYRSRYTDRWSRGSSPVSPRGSGAPRSAPGSTAASAVPRWARNRPRGSGRFGASGSAFRSSSPPPSSYDTRDRKSVV